MDQWLSLNQAAVGLAESESEAERAEPAGSSRLRIAASSELSATLHVVRLDLQGQFRGARWGELAQTLDTVAKLGETQGSRELCLRAQSLRELMGNRAGGRASAGDRVTQLFHELMFHLSHLQWLSQS